MSAGSKATPQASQVSLSPADGAKREFFGGLIEFKVRGSDTDGAYAVLELQLPANSGPPRMHVHPTIETFQLLEGEYEFRTVRDGQPVSFRAKSGDTVHVPGGVPHTFKNVGTTPARCHIILAPAAMEGYFDELSTPATRGVTLAARPGPPDVQHFIAVGHKYGVEFAEA
jgi:quercetin dioxygenase-like cupin family protein